MKVKITQSMSGTHRVRNVGDEIDLPEEKALRFVAAGVAVALDSKAYEAAVAKQTAREKAVQRQSENSKAKQDGREDATGGPDDKTENASQS